MPSIVGAVKIIHVQQGSVIQFGDSLQIRPSSSNKTFAGSGSFVTGDLPRTNNAVSATNTNDPDVQDSSVNQAGGGAGGSVA